MRIVLMVMVLLMGACASSEQEETAETDGLTRICTYEKELGSYIKTERCRTVKETRQRRATAVEDLRTSIITVPD